MEPNYLEARDKLAGNAAESARTESLPDVPPMALLLTALVQPVAWYLCISPNYHRHTAPSIELLQEAVKLNNLVKISLPCEVWQKPSPEEVTVKLSWKQFEIRIYTTHKDSEARPHEYNAHIKSYIMQIDSRQNI